MFKKFCFTIAAAALLSAGQAHAPPHCKRERERTRGERHDDF